MKITFVIPRLRSSCNREAKRIAKDKGLYMDAGYLVVHFRVACSVGIRAVKLYCQTASDDTML